jgi:hypothetical protein
VQQLELERKRKERDRVASNVRSTEQKIKVCEALQCGYCGGD